MKKTKMSFAVISVFVLITTLFCVIALAESGSPSGAFGENISWTLDNGVLTLSGSGETFDFEADRINPSIESQYRREVHTLKIGEGITYIGKNAFNGFYYLENISFPATLERIGERAFYESNIKVLEFPEGCKIERIEKEAFSSIYPLKNVDLTNCLELHSIGERAFAENDSLSFADLPRGVLSSIEKGAFEKNEYLLRISFPETLKSVGDGAFSGCSALISAEIPKEVENIGEGAFSGTVAVIFGESGSEAQKAAISHSLRFVEGDALQAVVIRQGNLSDEVSWTFDTNGTLAVYGKGYIGDFPSSTYAPWYHIGNAIESVTISDGITGIGRENFQGYKNIKSVRLPKTLETIGEYAFMGCEALEEIELPEGLATIAANAFYACESLREFNVPSTTWYINEWAIFNLDSLEKFWVAEGNATYYADENGVLFSADKTRLLKYPISNKSKTYTIPESVVRIDPQAFNGAKYLEEVIFTQGSTVERIETATFANSALKKIELPKGLRFIDGSAFSGCESLYEIDLPESVEVIYDWAFSRVPISEITLPSSLVTIGNSAFSDCNNLTEVIIPEGVTAVGTGAFHNCMNLEKIHIPTSLTWIDLSNYATAAPKLDTISVSAYNPCYTADEMGAIYFKKDELVWYPGNRDDTSYRVADGTVKIGKNAFDSAENLREVILPEGLTEISRSAFERCINLSEITIPSSVRVIDTAAFRLCRNLEKVIFEEGAEIERIGVYAFADCSSLCEFYLPDSVENIGNSAFYGCTRLESFYVGEDAKLERIQISSFSECPFVNIIAPEGSVAHEYAKKNRIDNRVKVVIDGEKKDFELYPTIINGRTLVPMRDIFEFFGAEVLWIEEAGRVVAQKDSVEITFTIDSDKMYIDGKEIKLDCAARIIADRTFVPLRAISEAFGYGVLWEDETRTVIIKK